MQGRVDASALMSLTMQSVSKLETAIDLMEAEALTAQTLVVAERLVETCQAEVTALHLKVQQEQMFLQFDAKYKELAHRAEQLETSPTRVEQPKPSA